MSADRLRASRGGPGWRAARQWQRRPPPTPTRPPTSGPSGRLRLPRPHVRPYATPIPVGSGFGRRFCSTTRVLPQAPGGPYTENGKECVLFFPLSALAIAALLACTAGAAQSPSDGPIRTAQSMPDTFAPRHSAPPTCQGVCRGSGGTSVTHQAYPCNPSPGANV